jgi:hypothetical protein
MMPRAQQAPRFMGPSAGYGMGGPQMMMPGMMQQQPMMMAGVMQQQPMMQQPAPMAQQQQQQQSPAQKYNGSTDLFDGSVVSSKTSAKL